MRGAAIVVLVVLVCLWRPTLAVAQAPSSGRAADVRLQLRRILSGPEYARPKPTDSALARFFRWLGELWEKLLRSITPKGTVPRLGGSAAILRPILLGVLFAGLAALVAFAAVRIVRYVAGLEPRERKTAARPPNWEPDESAEADPDDWLAVANRHAQSGDWRSAFRAAFISVLIRLDRRGAIRFRKGRTNGDYLRELADRPEVQSVIRPVALQFDAIWYGRASATREHYDAVVGAHRFVGGLPGDPA